MKHVALQIIPKSSYLSHRLSWLKVLIATAVMILFNLVWVNAFAQSRQVSGTVTDTEGAELPGVNVFIKGTTSGTITDVNGEYSINLSQENPVLVFSYVGYVQEEVEVGSRSTINVALTPDITQLSEIVVVGYGTMERENVTGAISTVDVEEINKVPVPNIVETLRGQVAGLRVQRSSGQPGSGVSFTIRGLNSLGEGSSDIQEANQPIIVVDGVPLPGGNLNEINPDDIATINVIKDAGAGAIYGSSAANGVVLITTKNGTPGKPVINVDASYGLNELATRLNIMDGDEYIQYLFDTDQGSTVSGMLDPNELVNYVEGDFVDWQDVLLRTGKVYNVSAGVSGGSEKVRFYLNGDMYREEGIVEHSSYDRYSLRFNGDYTPNERITIGTRVQLTKSFADETSNVIEDFPGGSPGTFAPFIPILENTPLGDVYDSEGNYVKFVRDDQFQINPFHRYNESIVDRFVTRAYVNPYIEFEIIDGLKYTLNTFAEQRSQFYGRFTSSNYVDGDPSTAQIQKQTSTSYLLDNILSYKRVFGKHGIDATLVYGFQNNEWEQMDAFADKLATDLLGYHAIDVTSSADQRFSWDTDEWGRIYAVGRLGYDFEDKYVATVTVRRDGSSKYTGDNKYGIFPSYSLAWNAHNEDFWNRNWVLTNLKLRVSYGTLGNDRISTYRYQANPTVVVSTILNEEGETEDVVGYAKGTLANPYLKWETSKQLNIGLDFGLFGDKLFGSVDAYRTQTTDLLLPQIIPIINGYESYITNIGETETSGIDVSLKGTALELGAFKWDATINWATNKTEIVRLNRTGANGEPLDDEANGWFIGEDINEIYNYKYIGVWQEDEADLAQEYNQVPGDAKFLDVNNDKNITPGEDRVFLGNPTPDWYGGITNTFSYKGIQLSVLLEVVQGVTVVNSFYGTYAGRNNQIAINYWTPENPSNEFPRAGSSDWTGTRGDAVKTQDASFISLRNVSLSYYLPDNLLDRSPLETVSVYVRGNNLKYFTEMEDAYSPETGRGEYPILRNWTFGTSITF